MRGILKVDVPRCIACKACEIACVVAHSESKTLLGALREEPRPASRIRVRYLSSELSAPYQCRHCENPWCAEGCPHGALGRAGDMAEPVALTADACQAAKKCLRACPYDALRMTEDGTKAYKCDLCVDRLNEGLEPACAEACPTAAIVFVEGGSPRPEGSVADRQYLVIHEGTSAEYAIDPAACTGCGACARKCPQQCISGEKKAPHTIDLSRCIRCGACFLACKFDAIGCTAPTSALTAAGAAAATE
ncbi:MAG: 4Fe-4S dicluster domain-containing protein [Armatimonadetes bacterium]|nr:4Fe-4S dicluster domain-containing protein [Armatimonadota bacterium]